MPLRVFNVLSGKKEGLEPIQNGQIKMFVCGPTVYDLPHLGHARTYIAYDMIVRYLKLIGYTVHFIVNITDIDDKIYKRSIEESIPAEVISNRFSEEYFEAMSLLKINSISSYEKASDYVNKVIDQISILLKKGIAYRSNKEIFFNTSKFREYGKLSKQTKRELLLRRLELNPAKLNQSDFPLWRRNDLEGPTWESPFGRGRPGWHIEDTAISITNFGEQYDFHGGADELIFPHHEAEIAQAEALTGISPFVKYWIHTGILEIGKEKMSKSLGNVITIKKGITEFGVDLLRLYFGSFHYSQKMNISRERMKEIKKKLIIIEEAVTRINSDLQISKRRSHSENSDLLEKLKHLERRFHSAMENDFDTPKATQTILSFAIAVNETVAPIDYKTAVQANSSFSNMLSVIGLFGY